MSNNILKAWTRIILGFGSWVGGLVEYGVKLIGMMSRGFFFEGGFYP
jgi:hypothetical protein